MRRHKNTPRDGATQVQESWYQTGQEDKRTGDFQHKTTWDQQGNWVAGPGCQGKGDDRGDGCRRIEPRKGEPTGDNRDAFHIEGGKGGGGG